MCAEQKLEDQDALKVVGLKDMHYRILKIIENDLLNETEKPVSKCIYKKINKTFN